MVRGRQIGPKVEIAVQIWFMYLLFSKYAHVYTTDYLNDIEDYQQFATFFNVVLLVRVLRLFDFLNELETWKFFVRTLRVLKGPFFNLCLTLYSLYFFYSLLGIHIYGGKINAMAFAKLFHLNEDFDSSPDYIWLNFNDFLSGLITLFSMMLFNNWQFIWDQFNFVVDNRTTSGLYFFSFMVMSQYVLINILMAFIIDVYTSIEEQQKKEQEERQFSIKIGKTLME